MKKTLFMLALGLTIVTSMVAGTMAIYTHTDKILANGNASLDAVAKKFYVGAKTTAVVNEIKLAPGESEDWRFKVTNTDANGITSEVTTDLVVNVDLGTVVSAWDDFDVILKKGETVVGQKSKDSNTITFNVDDAFIAETPANDDYSLEFIWLDDGAAGQLTDDQDTALVMDENGVKAVLPQVTGISVTVTGNQSTN